MPGHAARQVVVVPLRINVNLKAMTVEDLVARRKVGASVVCQQFYQPDI